MRRPTAAVTLALTVALAGLPIPAHELADRLRDRVVAVQQLGERARDPLDDLLRGPRRVHRSRRSPGPAARRSRRPWRRPR